MPDIPVTFLDRRRDSFQCHNGDGYGRGSDPHSIACPLYRLSRTNEEPSRSRIGDRRSMVSEDLVWTRPSDHVQLPDETISIMFHSELAYSSFLMFVHSGIGDTIMLTPMLQRLRSAWPKARVICTVNRHSREILELADLRLEFIDWPKYWRRNPFRTIRGLVALERCGAEALIAPTGINLGLAAWVALASCAKKKVGMFSGFDGSGPGVPALSRKAFTDLICELDHLHKVEHLLQALSVFSIPFEPVPPTLHVSETARETVIGKMAAEIGFDLSVEKYITVHLGCEPLLRPKLWPLDRMVQLLERIYQEKKIKCLLLWGGSDRDLVKQALSFADNQKWLVPVPWEATLTETAAILSSAELALTNDSGIMHLASAVDTKVLAVFGPTNPNFCGPYGPKGAVVFRKVPCSPCYETPNFYKCPFDRRCLNQLPVDLVYIAASRIMDDNLPSVEVSLGDEVYLAPSVFRHKNCEESIDQ